jgi:amino acid transporter
VSAPGDERSEAQPRQPLVSWEEVTTTALGSALATVVLSRLGVAGTIIGAAATPVIIMLTTAATSREIGSARRRLAGKKPPAGAPWWQTLSLRRLRGHRLAVALATAGAAFVVVVAAITIAEALSGEPVSDFGRSGGSGYTFAPRRTRSEPRPQPPTGTTPATPGGGRSGTETTRTAPRPPTQTTTTPSTQTQPPATTPGGATAPSSTAPSK